MSSTEDLEPLAAPWTPEAGSTGRDDDPPPTYTDDLRVFINNVGIEDWSRPAKRKFIPLFMRKVDLELKRALCFITAYRSASFSAELRTEIYDTNYGDIKRHGGTEHFHRYSLQHYYLSGIRDIVQGYIFPDHPISQALEIAPPPQLIHHRGSSSSERETFGTLEHISAHWDDITTHIKNSCDLRLKEWFDGCHPYLLACAESVIDHTLRIRGVLLFSDLSMVYGYDPAIRPEVRSTIATRGSFGLVEVLPAVVGPGRLEGAPADIVCHSLTYEDEIGERDCRWCRQAASARRKDQMIAKAREAGLVAAKATLLTCLLRGYQVMGS